MSGEERQTFRNRRRVRFTQIGNNALLDPRLSLAAKGLLGIMLSRPDGWVYHMDWLAKQSSDSMYALRKTLKELIALGYVVRTPKRGERGRVMGWEYEVSDDPADLKPEEGNVISTDFTIYRQTVAPTFGVSHTTNTDLPTNTDLHQEKEGAENRRASPGPQSATDSADLTSPPGGGAADAAGEEAPSSSQVETQLSAAETNNATTTKKVPGGGAAARAEDMPLPGALAALPGFAEAWAEWLAYRRFRKLTTAPATLSRQLKMLEGQPDPVAVIEQTITNGWNGLFPLKAPAAPRTQQDANARAVQTAQAVYNALQEDTDVPF